MNSKEYFSSVSFEVQGKLDIAASDWSDLCVLSRLLHNSYIYTLTVPLQHAMDSLSIHGLENNNNHSYDSVNTLPDSDQIYELLDDFT